MKILALGSLTIPYIGGNWFQALRHELGTSCVIMHSNLFLGGGPSNRAKVALEQGVMEYVREHRPDYFFVYQDWCFEDMADSLFEKVRAAGVRTVCFHPDDEPEFWYARNRKYDPNYDIVATHARRGQERRRMEGFPGKVLYLPWGYNHRHVRPDFTVPKQWDIVFVGKNKVVDNQTLPKEDGAARESAFTLIARIAEARGYSFRLFGEGWEQHPTLSRYAGGFLSYSDTVRVFQASRLVFNPGWTGDGDGVHPQSKLRHFEVPGAGALQISNWNPELAELFQEGEETLFYRSEAELEDLITGALADPAALDRKCRAAAVRALAEHTLEQRVRTLADYLREDMGDRAPRELPPPAPRIERRICPDRASLEAVLEEVRGGTFAPDTWFHVLPGRVLKTQTFDGGLAHFTSRNPGRPLRVRTSLDVTGQTKVPIHIHWTQQVLFNLAETFRWQGANPMPAAFIRRWLDLLEADGDVQWLGNWVIPAARAGEILEAWLAGDWERLRRTDPLNTGYLLNHLSVAPLEGWDANAAKMQEVEALLRKAAERDWGVVFYGVHGVLPGQVLPVAARIPGLKVRGVVDRSLTSRTFGEWPVIPREDLFGDPPDLILINAVVSGPELLAYLEPLEPRTRLAPVFDLRDPRWDVLLP